MSRTYGKTVKPAVGADTLDEALIDVGYHLDLFDSEGLTSPTTQHLKNAVERLFDAVMFLRANQKAGD